MCVCIYIYIVEVVVVVVVLVVVVVVTTTPMVIMTVVIPPGLTLELYIEHGEYIADLSPDAGVKLVVHNQSYMPFPEDDGFVIAPGTKTAIGLTLVRHLHNRWYKPITLSFVRWVKKFIETITTTAVIKQKQSFFAVAEQGVLPPGAKCIWAPLLV